MSRSGGRTPTRAGSTPSRTPSWARSLSDERLASFAAEVERAVRPVHNTFLLPDYRRRMVSVYVRRALTQLREGKAA